MTKKWTTIHPNVKGMMHGGDYNPDQWQHLPEAIDEDFRLMKLAHANAFSVNIFGWSALEREEGVYTFGWLDDIMDRLAEQGAHAILATPSGARPAWMSEKYPEVLRIEENRKRNLHGRRHNHCFTSPVYRQKTQEMNRMLAERYKNHPALVMWHVSNEYSGTCHCDLCQAAFRQWLKQKYNNDLDQLNKAWWTGFWSHTYTSWEQIESPAPHGENEVHALTLDWRRFTTDQTVDFYRNEIAPLREITPDIPLTTNFMGNYPRMKPFVGLNYAKFANDIDVISWDAYPAWHNPWQSNAELARDVAFVHNLYRSMKGGKPFLILECTPSFVNWQKVNKAKRPGMHLLSSLQSIAHGSDSVMYFQWRKGLGSSEKFHGAVVDHTGRDDTRVFRDVAEVGKSLGQLSDVAGTSVEANVAIVFDWENEWAIQDAQGFATEDKKYIETLEEHYRYFWERGISVDVITPNQSMDDYKLIICPMLYMIPEGFAEKTEAYVQNGGTFVTTYATGLVNETDLAFTTGGPGPFQKLLGIRTEEIDTLYPEETREIVTTKGVKYKAQEYCELIHAEDAESIAFFTSDFYADQPAATVRTHGKGKAYYIASRNEESFQDAFYEGVAKDLDINTPYGIVVPKGVSLQVRTDGDWDYLFVMNFSESPQRVQLGEQVFEDMLAETTSSNTLHLEKYGVRVLKTKRN
ncbi:beta-galactosidase [Aureibacillus halotolerans]|uniref:Beta-galactosidase n=1 Tax=Aureibacillus halotolerans TaxID=1508390 RepID=A0A4R6U8Z2_9BACI|nr:beta-galactosidase [Aureibacillus halotolerans]TDQ41125.1 beta-galactosidase [Aureibacillus halotolerans]